MNILNKTAKKLCTSCGVCASVCTRKAISMIIDDDGFYRPFVDADSCNNCSLCTTVCYKFDEEIKMTSDEGIRNKPLYSAWSNDDDLVRQTTSGGLGDLLAHQLLKDGYKVVGVIYNEEQIRAEHRIADCADDLLPFRGSKYIQSYTFGAFKEVVANCRNEKYAVFGTPCQIYALNKLAIKRKIRDHFFFVDLYCHGCPSLFAWTKYQADIKNRVGVDNFDSVSFRSKIRGWGGFYIVVVVDGKPVCLSSKSNDKFYELFFSNHVLNEACHDCQLRSTLEYTDIRLGDFWGHKFLDNHRGVSAISLATERGVEVFKKLESINSALCSYEEFLQYQSWNRTYTINSDTRKAVLASLSDTYRSFDDAIKVLRKHQGVKSSVIRHIRSVLALFPLGLTNGIKKVLYKFR